MTSPPPALPSERPLVTLPDVSPNYVNPQTLAPAIIIVSIVMMAWAVLFVVVRLYANYHAPRGLGIDDYFCVIATVFSVALTGVRFSLNRMARHIYDIPFTWLDAYYLKRSFAENIIAGPTLFFAKGAIFLLYLRIFSISRNMRYGIWFGLTWNFLLYWINLPLSPYFCAPRVGHEWDVAAIAGTCMEYTIFSVVQGVLAVVLDLYIFILPIPIILRLRMSRRRRLSVLGVFGTAFLGITAAAVSMVFRIKLHTTNDFFWANACVYICTTCENYVAIIVGSMPAFASFFKGSMPGAFWLASITSLGKKCKCGPSSSQMRLSLRSMSGIAPGEFGISGGHAREKGYFELDSVQSLGEWDFGSMRTEIREEVAAPRIIEEDVVHKTVAVDSR